MAKKTLYIAYGSNLNVGQMGHRCPDAEVVGTGMIRDYRLEFKALGSNAFATIEPCEGESAPVAVWQISRRDEMALDCYEGYPTHYGREWMDVQMDGEEGETITGLVYVMNPRAVSCLPSQGYYDAVLSGYRYFFLDEGKLREAWQRAAEADAARHNPLKFYRRERGLTQAQLADAAAVSLKTLQKYESGERNIQRARTDTVLRIAGVLEVSPYLLSGR